LDEEIEKRRWVCVLLGRVVKRGACEGQSSIRVSTS
jgi:hypothetical protein